MMPSFTIAELLARRPVWDALSTMFLDTDVSLSRAWRVRTLVASDYSVAELEEILIDEVYPACVSNLFNVAGEWAEFDPAWLEARILKHRSPLLRALNLGRLTVPLSSEWRATKREVQRARDPAS